MRLDYYGWPWLFFDVPEGYELREKEDHKKKRLEEEVKLLKEKVDWHSDQAVKLAKALEEKKKELE